MTPRQPVNIPASIRERLHNITKKDKGNFELLLTSFATERFLYRLGLSEYADRFVLKGARLMALWLDEPLRSTRDLDLLGYGESSPDTLLHAFRSICQTSAIPDGMSFDVDSIQVEPIRHQQAYDGHRIKLLAYLDRARIVLQIDIGFGDAVIPTPSKTVYPTILDTLPRPAIRAYPQEAVIAEKFHAMVSLGIQNTRMKDFFDVCTLARQFTFQGTALIAAIQATFERRVTALPDELPPSLQQRFALGNAQQSQWKAFIERTGILQTPENEFSMVLLGIREFLEEPLFASRVNAPFPKSWKPREGWREHEKMPN